MLKRLCTLCWWLLPFSLASPATRAEVPNLIRPATKPDAAPIWVSIDQALTPSGELRPGLLSELDRAQVESVVSERASFREKAAAGGEPVPCPAIQVSGHGHSERTTLEVLASRAQLAIVGHITDRKQGILHGQLLTLYEVAVDELLASPGLPGRPTTFLMISPEFDHEFSGVRVCHAGLRYPAAPELGKGVLLLASEIALREPLLINPMEGELFFETAAGVSLPPSFGTVLAPPAWPTFLQQATEALAKAGFSKGGG